MNDALQVAVCQLVDAAEILEHLATKLNCAKASIQTVATIRGMNAKAAGYRRSAELLWKHAMDSGIQFPFPQSKSDQPAHPDAVEFDRVMDLVCRDYGVTRAQVLSRSHAGRADGPIHLARCLIAYCAYHCCHLPWEVVSMRMNRKDKNSTWVKAQRVETDPELLEIAQYFGRELRKAVAA